MLKVLARFSYICGMKVKIYDKYEQLYLETVDSLHGGRYRNATSSMNMWEEREVTEEELLQLIRDGEKILINM